MSSPSPEPSTAIESVDKLLELLNERRVLEVTCAGVEFKSSWDQAHGKDISAMANSRYNEPSWLVIGVDDKGACQGKTSGWLQAEEERVSNHINQYLSPSWAAAPQGRSTPGGCILILEIRNPGEVVTWNNKAYKLT